MSPRTTLDGFLEGALELEQPASGEGYRANVDALHLARFAARIRPSARRAVDLGAGVGTVALAYTHIAEAHAMVLVEREPLACELARRNVARARRESTVRVLERDVDGVSQLDIGGAADLVLANPPYTDPRGGRPSKQAGVDAARHGSVAPFLRAMARLLSENGIACLCYPAHALVDLLEVASAAALQPDAFQPVHANAAHPARIVLLALRGGADRPASVRMDPPVHDRED